MRAEIVAVGTELLIGQIANTNARWMSERLAELGIDVLHHQVVGDNEPRIVEAIALATSRADVVIVTGGLGPTQDDVTRPALAEAAGARLVRHAEIEDALRDRFRVRGRDMPESNLAQADVPEGGRAITPERGTAPGLVVSIGGATVYAIPGVPSEMREMMEGTILPELSALAGPASLVSRTLRVYGLAESRISELLDDLFHASSNPTVAYLAGGGEVHVRLTAKGSAAEANALLDPLEERVRERLGDHVYGSGDEPLEAVIGRLLAERGLDDRVRRVAHGRRPRRADHRGAGRLVLLPGFGRHVLARGQAVDPRRLGGHARRAGAREPRVRGRDGLGGAPGVRRRSRGGAHGCGRPRASRRRRTRAGLGRARGRGDRAPARLPLAVRPRARPALLRDGGARPRPAAPARPPASD